MRAETTMATSTATKLVRIPAADLKVAESLKTDAQKYFGQMQRSWYFFAKTIYQIRETEVYTILGRTSFKEFCMTEYPSISWSTICKFVAIVEGWGRALDAKVKDDDFQLPAYESCYRLTVVEDKLPKEEVTKLRKQVLDNKLTYQALQDRLKEQIDKARSKMRDEVDRSTDAIERELEADIRNEYGEYGESDGFMDAEAFGDEELEEEDGMGTTVSALRSRVAYLRDNLPELQQQLTRKTITDDTIELAKELESLADTVNDFLNKVEEVSDV